MAERNYTIWPEKFGIGIRNRVLGLNFCIDKLDEKIIQLVIVTGAWKEGKPLSSSTVELFVLKTEDVRKGINETLVQYRDACDQNKEEEEEANVMKGLKELIIEVYKIKRDVDQQAKGLDELDPSQDVTAEEGGEHQDWKGKGLIIDDSDDDNVVMKFDPAESSQAGSFTELRKDAILTLSSSSTEGEITDGHEEKDEDVRERFLNMVSKAFSLSETSENNDDVGHEDSNTDSDDEVGGGVEELAEDLMQMIIERGNSSGSSSENAEEEAGIL